ncbi:MAG TPA: response regulator [Flavisolibacter sp.]|jgi:DNA-binding response OmpR family regulator|nr:response regulator [Flavisolibacter sp.]
MKQNVLIIEENVAMRYLLTTVLATQYRPISHANCYNAVSDLKKNDIRVIIVNIGSQNSKNFDFLMHLNSSSFYSGIPVIVISNNNSNDLRLKCLELGVEAFFLKPFDPLSLLECIKDVLFISGNMRRMSEDFTSEFEQEERISVK